MTYEEYKEINDDLRAQAYFQRFQNIKHLKIENIIDENVYCIVYSTHQKNKEKVIVEEDVVFKINDLLKKLENREFYINNLSMLKNLI